MALLQDLLRGVSRAFYLTLRVLPARLREPVGLAYLLARAADTIADTRLLPPNERLKHLLAFRELLEGSGRPESLKAIAGALTQHQSNPHEVTLLQSLPEAFALLEELSKDDRRRVCKVVNTLTQGMEQDLKTFPAEDSGGLAALQNPEELETYTYFVAGCVGEFWTEITMAYTPALRHWDMKEMSETGVRFGKALQYTNVLRDVPRDLRQGRCYLPLDELQKAGLRPEDLLTPANSPKARPVLMARMRAALAHYQEAERYLLAIPRRCLRLRLAVFWPLLMGLATLALLARNQTWLDPQKPNKVTRGWVYRMMVLSVGCIFSNTVLNWWIGKWQERVGRALNNKG